MNNVSNLLGATASPEVIAALIALAGVLVSVLISLSLGLATRKYNYNQLFAQTVSTNRMDWINVWRESISTFLACANVLRKYCSLLQNEKQGDKKTVGIKDTETGKEITVADSPAPTADKLDEYIFKMEHARRMITTRLNMKEEMHIMMFNAINRLNYSGGGDKEFNAQCELIEQLARSILKPEWERVKEEAKGKRR